MGEDHLVSFGEPVLFWLRELSLVHEAECTIMLQSKPVDPGNFAKRATSFTSEKSFLELAQLDNHKPEKMDTGMRIRLSPVAVYIYIIYIYNLISEDHFNIFTNICRRRWH